MLQRVIYQTYPGASCTASKTTRLSACGVWAHEKVLTMDKVSRALHLSIKQCKAAHDDNHWPIANGGLRALPAGEVTSYIQDQEVGALYTDGGHAACIGRQLI